MIPLMKRCLPSADELINYLGKSEARGQYTNFGILHQELQLFFATRYQARISQVALMSSATSALSICIKYYQQLTSDNDFLVVMPSWTFAATAHSALFVGSQIVFVDTDKNGLLDPIYLKKLLSEDVLCKPSLVMPVIPFGRLYDVKSWEDFYSETGIPVVIDCAAGFSSAQLSVVPTIVSTHATKYFPTCEGGFVLCANEDLIASVKSSSNFGFQGSRSSIHIGTNAKLSEYHAAVGLAFKDNHLSKSSKLYGQQFKEYSRHLHGSPFQIFGNSVDNPVSTFNIQFPDCLNYDRIELIFGMMISRHGVEIRRWWQSPLHIQPAFASCNVIDNLTNSNALARRVIGVPIGEHLDTSLIQYIIESLVASYHIAMETSS